MKRPNTCGLRHIALKVNKFNECIQFYRDIIGMEVELQTDDYVYLTTGSDNISLHRVSDKMLAPQRLEHFGFLVDSPEQVDRWFEYISKAGAIATSPPTTFGIGTRSFSIIDPEGFEVEFTYHPPMLKHKS